MDVRQQLVQVIGELMIRVAELSAERDALAAKQTPAPPPVSSDA